MQKPEDEKFYKFINQRLKFTGIYDCGYIKDNWKNKSKKNYFIVFRNVKDNPSFSNFRNHVHIKVTKSTFKKFNPKNKGGWVIPVAMNQDKNLEFHK